MLNDSDTNFKRTVVNKEVDLAPYGNTVQVKLVRIYQGANLFGYTFLFRNLTNHELQIEPQNLAIGTPNRAIMAQSDRYTLKSCETNKLQCVSAVRYVVKNEEGLALQNSALEEPFNLDLPYAMANPSPHH